MRHHQIELEHRVPVAADAETVYDMIADVTRTGEWSPECISARWVEGTPGAVGATFVGSNFERNGETGQEWRWDMICEVVEADRPYVFAWAVMTEAWDRNTSVWRYTIAGDDESADNGVMLSLTYRMDRPPQGWQPILARHDRSEQLALVAKRRDRLDRGMQATLAAIAEAATQSPPTD